MTSSPCTGIFNCAEIIEHKPILNRNIDGITVTIYIYTVENQIQRGTGDNGGWCCTQPIDNFDFKFDWNSRMNFYIDGLNSTSRHDLDGMLPYTVWNESDSITVWNN